MAKIRFKCACGRTLAVAEQHAGRIATCPACQRKLQVPQPDNAPAPADIPAADLGSELASLSDAYGAAVLAKARRERVDAALKEYDKKTRKRNRIIVISLVSCLLLGFVLFKVFRRCGPPLGALDNYPESAQPFLRGLNSCDPLVRTAATWEVADAAGGDISITVALMLRDEDPMLRIVAARALGRIDPTAAPTHLEPLLGDPALDVRMTAAFVIALCENNPVSPTDLEPHMEETLKAEPEWLDWFKKANAEQQPSPDTLQALERRLASARPKARALAAWMTAAALGPDARLLMLLGDKAPSVRVSALHALQPFLTRTAFAQLRASQNPTAPLRGRFEALQNAALKLRHHEARRSRRIPQEPQVRFAAALAIADNAQNSAAYLFTHALTDEEWFPRFAALKGLEKMAPDVAIAVIRTARNDQPREHNKWTERVEARIIEKARQVKPGDK